jgi:hypothetical protein
LDIGGSSMGNHALGVVTFGPRQDKTTFDLDEAVRGEHASGHELDFDGKPIATPLDMDRPVTLTRPSGGGWSTVHDLAKYVRMELAGCKLPDGARYVSEEALLERRKPQVAMSDHESYGMGLWVDRGWGCPGRGA